MFVFQTVKHVVTHFVCVCGCTLRLSSTLAAVSRSRLWGASSGYVWLYNLYFSEQKRTNPTWTEAFAERRCQAYFVPLSSQCQGYSSCLWAAVTELQCQQQDTQCKNHWAKWGISWRPAGFVNVKKKPKLQIRTRPNNPGRTLWCSSLKWCLDLNPKPEMSFLSAHVPPWVKRRLMWAWEHFSAQCLSVSEQLCGWGLRGKRSGLVSILIVKQCHSQNSKWGMGVRIQCNIGIVSHFLTLRDKLDIFFMWQGETLFVMIVCGQSWSRVMVFLTIRTVENNLWSGKSERGTREVLCWFLQERKCSLSFPSRNFLKWYHISKKVWLSRSKKLQQLNEGPCDPRSHTRTGPLCLAGSN